MVAANENTPGPDGPPPAAGEKGASPYRNLMVPLVVVPALIVMVLLAVFLLFGSIAGSEPTVQENLERAVEGGANERQQAVFGLVRQIEELQRAELEGREPPFELDESFLPEVRAAWRQAPADEHELRYVLASLLVVLGDDSAVPHLVELLELPDSEDPDGVVRFHTLATLGTLGDARATEAVVGYLDHPDPGLRAMAAVALQRVETDAARAALREALGDPDVNVRGNAAIALSVQGDPAGADVLVDLLDPELYARENARAEQRYTRGADVTQTRLQALEALARLRRPQDRALVEELADPATEADLRVREAALRILDEWREDG